MLFRVYDKKNKKWIKDNIYLTPSPNCLECDLYVLKKNIFGVEKLKLIPYDRYVIHRDIELYDKEDELVFEGDYIKAKVSENKTVIGLVVYAQELSSYVILCIDSDEFYTLGSEVTEFIEVIGNVFDGYEKE